MTDKKYPKEIITIEKTTENSTNETAVKIVVNNFYEEEAVRFAIDFQDKWNNRDIDEYDKDINFPHARVGADGNLVITESPPILPKGFFKWFIKSTEWNHSCFDYIRVIQSSQNKVHLAIQFSRYKADGTKIGSYPSLWVITNEAGHWGVKMRSSFAP